MDATSSCEMLLHQFGQAPQRFRQSLAVPARRLG